MDFNILSILLSCFKTLLKVLPLCSANMQNGIYMDRPTSSLVPCIYQVLEQKNFVGLEIYLKILFHYKVLSTKLKYLQNRKQQQIHVTCPWKTDMKSGKYFSQCSNKKHLRNLLDCHGTESSSRGIAALKESAICQSATEN